MFCSRKNVPEMEMQIKTLITSSTHSLDILKCLFVFFSWVFGSFFEISVDNFSESGVGISYIKQS